MKALVINIRERVGEFAEDKDAAVQMRNTGIVPALNNGRIVTLDFTGVRLATQSFVHALVSDVLRRNGEMVLERLVFKGCTPVVKGIVQTVVQYSLESNGSKQSELPPK